MLVQVEMPVCVTFRLRPDGQVEAEGGGILALGETPSEAVMRLRGDLELAGMTHLMELWGVSAGPAPGPYSRSMESSLRERK